MLEILRDLEAWGTWLPGVRHCEVVAHTNSVVVELDFVAPRTLLVRLDVKERVDGITFRLVEGDLASLSGEVAVSAIKGGCAVVCSLQAAFPTSVPGVLLAELEREVVPSWCNALIEHR